jgi:K+-sensing histidine kinase KdpD
MTEDGNLNEKEKREYSGIIQSNSAELIQLVNNVLDLSRLEANMMKFQLQNCNVQEWCNELPYLVQMRSEGYIHLELQADVDNAIIYTDVSRFTQIISSMLLYPVECKKPRRIGMQLVYNQEKQEINFRIDNSPLADSAFASQKEAILQKINLLFFEHFNGSYRVENCENNPIIFFTYPALIT